MALIISNEQIEHCLRYLRETKVRRTSVQARVAPEQLSKIKAYLQHLPEVREPTVTRLRNAMPTYEVDSRLVAEKMIGRFIGDMVR